MSFLVVHSFMTIGVDAYSFCACLSGVVLKLSKHVLCGFGAVQLFGASRLMCVNGAVL